MHLYAPKILFRVLPVKRIVHIFYSHSVAYSQKFMKMHTNPHFNYNNKACIYWSEHNIYNILFKKYIIYNINLTHSFRILHPSQFPVENDRQCFTPHQRSHREKNENKTWEKNLVSLVLSSRSCLDECWRHTDRDSDDKHLRLRSINIIKEGGGVRTGHRRRD